MDLDEIASEKTSKDKTKFKPKETLKYLFLKTSEQWVQFAIINANYDL